MLGHRGLAKVTRGEPTISYGIWQFTNIHFTSLEGEAGDVKIVIQ